MEISVEKTQRTFIRLFFGLTLGFILFVLACWGGWHGYTAFESRHLVRRGKAYLGSSDLRNAALSAQRALQLDDNNLDAVRLLAETAEASSDRSALSWRRKAVQLNPKSIEDAIALANCAVRFNELPTAEKTLDGIEHSAGSTAEYAAARARLAESKGQLDQAQDFWEKAIALKPGDQAYQLPYAIVLLKSGDPSKRDQAVRSLEKLRTDPQQRVPATRALIANAITTHSVGDKISELAHELQSYPEATFSDRLLYLDVLRKLNDPKFTEFLTTIEKSVEQKPVELAALINWMTSSSMPLLGIDYARTLTEAERNQWPVNLTLAEAYEKAGDWAGLEQFVKTHDWGSYEFLRHAYLARALRSENKGVPADREWAMAEKQAGGQIASLKTLVRAATDWKWPNETAELLWLLSDQTEARTDALQQLYQHYIEAGDTPGLYKVLGKLSELNPTDLDIQNNLAQVALLLHVDTERARKSIAEIYRKQPSNAAYATTYAFSLFGKGDAAGALAVMNRLTEAQLEEPAVAAYYGMFLSATGDNAKAREYLDRGAGAKLLPEEKALLTQIKPPFS